MKTKGLTVQQIAHIWANTLPTSENWEINFQGNSLSCKYGKLWSYSTIIGQILINKNNEVVSIIDTTHYSSTTNRHQLAAKLAVHGKRYCFKNAKGNCPSDILKIEMLRINKIINEAELPRKQKRTIEKLKQEALHAFEYLSHFASDFGLKLNPLEKLRGVYLKEMKTKTKALKAANARALALAKLWQNGTNIAKWQNGELHQIPYDYQTDKQKSVYCRISNNGNYLETSKGANVPLTHAIRIFKLIELFISEQFKGAFVPKSPMKVGHFTLDYIDFDKQYMKVGCHRFSFERIFEVANIAKERGLI